MAASPHVNGGGRCAYDPYRRPRILADVFVLNWISIAPAVSLLAAGIVVRQSWKRRFEQRSLAHLPVGPDGVIPGARAFTLLSPDPAGPAALLLHGFGDTPQTLGYLAADLNRRGWTVRVPLLPGHGRTLPEFARSRGTGWLGAARSELAAARAAHDAVALVGLSLGGALATILAAETRAESSATVQIAPPTIGPPAPVVALALVSPYLSMPTPLRIMAELHWAIAPFVPYWPATGGGSILDPVERDRSRGYGATTPRLIHELATLARRGWAALPAIGMPTLIVQSHQDNRIAPAVAESAYARLTVADKRLTWIDRGGHVITVDLGREQVVAAVGDWLDAHWPAASSGSLVAGGG